MSIIATIGVFIFFLIGTFVLTASSSAFRRLKRHRSKEELRALGEKLFYTRVHRAIFPKAQVEEILFAVFCAQNITRFCSGVTVVFILAKFGFFDASAPFFSQTEMANLLTLGLAVCFSLLFGEYIPRTWSRKYSKPVLNISAPIASLYLIAFLPISYLFLRLSRKAWSREEERLGGDVVQIREKIIELVEEASADNRLDQTDKKLIESAVTFRERIVREVMVPRVNLFALPVETPVREAARVMAERGFSRVPIYTGTMDQVVGILMYKDILATYMQSEHQDDKSALDTPVSEYAKPVLYTPETKKISDLLQEFRNTQMHIAIVVDEYGGTEGVVTIEDLLEEIVGDIDDEYDQKEDFYTVESNGGWIVDARMSILDLEEQLGLRIPQDGEYDTVGGYVFHKAGTIPSKGLVIHHDDFELEILSSSDRCVEKVRITPIGDEAQIEESVANPRPVNE